MDEDSTRAHPEHASFTEFGWRKRAWQTRYGVAILVSALALALRHALTPVIGTREFAFGVFLPAILFAAWFGGFLAGALCTLASAAASVYYFTEPVGSFFVRNRGDQISLLTFAVLALGISWLAGSHRRIAERAAQAENTEQAERERLQITLASIGDAVVVTDAEGRVTFANKVALLLLRSRKGEITGKPLDEVFKIVNEYSRTPVDSPVAKVLRDGVISGLANHTVLIAQDGTETPIDDSAAPIRDRGGIIRGTVLVFRDITERRRAESERQLLASIIESSDDAIISKDLNGTVTHWNKGAARIFGYAENEVIGKPISILAAPGHLDEMPRILEQIGRGERVDHFQTVRRAKDGKLVHVSLTVSPMHDASGKIIGASKIARDITAQMQAQAEVAEQRERLWVTLSSIGDAVMATDAQGQVTFANKVALSLLRSKEADISGKPLTEVFRIVNEYTHASVENPVTRVLREGAIVGLANHTVLIAADGTETPIDDSAAPIRSGNAEIQGVVLVFRDITERRRAEVADQLLASIIESSDDAIISKNLKGMVTSWNKGAERIFRYSAEEMIGQPISLLAPADHRDEMTAILEKIGRGERIDHYQTVRRGKDGRLVHLSLTVSPVRDALGKIVGASKVARDITAQVEAQAEIAEQRERLRVTLRSIGDAVMTTNTASLISFLNPVAEKLTGWKSDEAAGKPVEEVFES